MVISPAYVHAVDTAARATMARPESGATLHAVAVSGAIEGTLEGRFLITRKDGHKRFPTLEASNLAQAIGIARGYWSRQAIWHVTGTVGGRERRHRVIDYTR